MGQSALMVSLEYIIVDNNEKKKNAGTLLKESEINVNQKQKNRLLPHCVKNSSILHNSEKLVRSCHIMSN